MRITQVDLKGLEPFANQSVSFKPVESDEGLGEVHLFTGPNGTGKSRLLAVMAAGASEGNFKTDRFPDGLRIDHYPVGPPSKRVVRTMNSKQIVDPRAILAEVHGLPLEAHGMPAFAFSGDALLKDSAIEIMKGAGSPDHVARLNFSRPNSKEINQIIANLKVQAAMEAMDGEGPSCGRWISIVQRLEQGIGEITGRRFAVIATARPTPKLEISWGGERLPISGIPDGLNAILSWILHVAGLLDLMCPESKDPLAEPAIIFLDEPETHLHPSWQRKVLPLAQRLFPQTQFFVATHSPFVVSSVNVGWIHKLRFTEGRKVEVAEAIPAPKGDSHLSALSEILEVAEWFDPESEALLEQFRTKRDQAMGGDAGARQEAEKLAEDIRSRGPELANVIGAEMRQLERVLAKSQ